MIKKIRNKMIIISCVSIFLVVVSIVGYINYVNHNKVANIQIDRITEVLENITAGVDYTGYNSDELIIINLDTDEIIQPGLLLQESVLEMYDHIMQEDLLEGTYETYAYLMNSEYLVISDITREIELSENFLAYSLIVSGVGLLIVYIIIFILSSYFIKPFELNELKQKQFMTDASHQLRTPLTIIKANTQIILDESSNEFALDILNQSERLEKIINDLSYLAKSDELKTDYIETSFSLDDCLTEEIERFENVFNNLNLKVTLDIDTLITCTANEAMIRELISTVLENAVKYNIKDGYINISLKNKNIVIENSTNNLPKGKYNNLLDRFTRGNVLDEFGSGIGLSIAYSIVNRHKGDINIYAPIDNVFVISIKL